MPSSSSAVSPVVKPTEHPTYKWLVLFVLFVVYTFNFLDRQLLSTIQEPIKHELGLSDSQLGLMTGFLFALFYTSFGVVVGFLADRTSRKNILFFGCTLWSLFTIASGFAKSFPQMAVARVGVGVGEAAGAPPSYSIVADYFPARQRGLALAIFSLGVPVGIALGAGFGAKIHELWGWRHAFVYIGLAGVVAGVVMFFVVKEPQRGRLDEAVSAPDSRSNDGLVASIRQFFTDPVLFSFAMAAGFGAFVGYSALSWNASFLLRVQGMSIADLSVYYAMSLAVSVAVGMLLSGYIIDLMAKRSPVWYGLGPMIAILAGLPCHWLYLTASDWQTSLLWMSLGSCCNVFYLAPAIAVVQNYARPEQRTMAGALLLMVLNLVGLGCGPTMVGLLSDYFATTHGSAEGLRMAMMCVGPGALLSAFFFWQGSRALQRRTAAKG